MRFPVRGWTAGVALGLVAQVAAFRAEAAETRRLTIHWSDPESQFPFETDELIAEARALFAPLGIELEWAPSGTTVTAEDVQVVLLAADRSRGRMGAHTMACVQGGPGAQPVAWILVPRVRSALGLPPELLPDERPILSRALARVMAHELIHLIAPGVPHAPEGLMNASLGREFLLRPLAPAIDRGLARAVRSAFASWPAQGV